MALESLAAPADLPMALAGHAKAQRALDVVSAAIRDAAESAIGPEQTATVTVEGTEGRVLRLPGPVISVTSVEVDGTARDADCYEVMANGLWSRSGWGCGPVPVEVTYTFGTEVPVDIEDLCVRLAVAWLQDWDEGMTATPGVKYVRIDDAAEGYTDEGAGQVSPVFIPDVTRRWLAARFGGGPTVVETL